MAQRIKGTQGRSAETRAAILAAATRLLDGRAFDAITVADIAAEAGVAKGSVLAHFSEKLAILAGFLSQELDETSARLEIDPDFARNPSRLAAALQPLLTYLLADRALLRLLTAEGSGEQCAMLLDPALARLRASLSRGFGLVGLANPDLCADVAIALASQVAVSGHARTGAEAAAALSHLAGVFYRESNFARG